MDAKMRDFVYMHGLDFDLQTGWPLYINETDIHLA